MKIYPDPERPDLEIEWYADECSPGAIVAISIVGVDEAAFRKDIDAACEDTKLVIADMPHQRFRIDGTLIEGNGEVYGMTSTEADLRAGLDDVARLYFDSGLHNFRARWTFDMGASCESLGADTISLVFSEPGGLEAFGFVGECSWGTYETYVYDYGAFTLRAFASSGDTRVAASPTTPELMITPLDFTSVMLVLSACTDPCE